MHHFTSDQFTWKGNRAVADVSELLNGKHANISRFSITSRKTGKMRFYEIDSSHPGYQDCWDGEYKVYTDNLWDGTRVMIVND